MVESVRWRRLRWRLRGAWQWPTFVVLTVVDAVLIARLPFQGVGADLFGAFIVAGFFNVLAVALAAPFAGMLLRRFRRDLPRVVARDYGGTAVLVLITLGLVAGGLIHRPDVADQRADRRAVYAAVHNYVVRSEPEFKGGLAAISTLQLEPEYYRACVPGPEELPICLFVNTDQSPAGITLDPSRDPNEKLRR